MLSRLAGIFAFLFSLACQRPIYIPSHFFFYLNEAFKNKNSLTLTKN